MQIMVFLILLILAIVFFPIYGPMIGGVFAETRDVIIIVLLGSVSFLAIGVVRAVRDGKREEKNRQRRLQKRQHKRQQEIREDMPHEERCSAIREAYSKGHSLAQIATDFEVKKKTVWHIVNSDSFK